MSLGIDSQRSTLCGIYPEKHKQHIQGNVLKTISSLINNSQTNVCFYKVKPHAGIAGNECADDIAEYQAKQANNSVADTGIPGAGPGGNPFSHFYGKPLARRKKKENKLLAHPQLLHSILILQ
eukprot:1147013-Pelagomonas_calceolata.AAC.1